MAGKLVIFNPNGRSVTIAYGIVAEEIFVGLARDGSKGELFPTIDIFYPDSVLPVVLQVGQEISRRKLSPKVCLATDGRRAYLAVYFGIENPSETLVAGLFTGRPKYYQYFRQSIGKPVGNFFMTSEGEFDVDDIQPFLTIFQKEGSFRVCFTQKTGRDKEVRRLWSATLFQYSPESSTAKKQIFRRRR